jgi:putative flippase GtrA
VTTKTDSQKVRFLLVGGINTAIDFGLLFTLRALGLPTIPANIISTSAAFCFSFFANKKYTFQTKNTNIQREIILFVVVTLFALWGIQTVAIATVAPLLSTFIPSMDIALLGAKLIATIATLIWNYSMYSRVVFKTP